MSDKRIFIISSLIILAFKIFSLFLGYFRDVLIAKTFGATSLTDAWYVASNIPELLFKFLMFGAFGASFFPIFVELISNKKEKEAWHIASSVINFSGLALFILSLIGIIFSPQLVYFFAPGFDQNTHQIAVNLTRLLLLVLAIMGTNGFLIEIYRAYFNFVVPAFCSIVIPLSLIFSILFFSRPLGIYSLGWATVAGFMISFLIMVVFLLKKRPDYRPIIDLKNPDVRRIGALMIPLIGAEIIGKGIGVVDRMFASTLENGSITALFLASRIFTVPTTIFSLTLATVTFPFLSRDAALNDKKSFENNLFMAIKLSLLVLIPSFAGLLIFGEKIIMILFQHGKFSSYNTQTTSTALFFLVWGLVFTGLHAILARCFYALKKNWVLFKFELLGFSLNAALDYILVKFMGLAGIALASTIISPITFFYLIYALKKEIPFKFSRIRSFILKVSLAAAIMGVASYMLNLILLKYLNLAVLFNEILYLAVIVLFSASLFFGMLFLMKIEEADQILKVLKKALLQK